MTASEATDEELVERLFAAVDELHTLATAVIRHLSADPALEAYLAWAMREFPKLAPSLFVVAGKPRDKVACWLARQLWNVMPVEANGYEPVPMPDPDPEAPCPCGSRSTYQACCSGFSLELPNFTSSLWPALAESRPASHWLGLARQGALPDVGRIHVGELLQTLEEWEHIVDLLAPRVAARDMAPDHCLHTMVLLGLAYRELDRTTDENTMLRRFAAHADTTVRCVANRRLATMLHAQGHLDRAWRHFRTAAQAAPDDPATALQEVVLLTEEGRHGDAEVRADEWCADLADAGVEPDDPLLNLVENFADDAQYGRDEYYLWNLPPEWAELVEWVDDAVMRPIPTPAWRRMQGTEDDDLSRDAHMPEPSTEIRTLEEQWHGLGGDQDDVDDEELDLDTWLLWLREHDEAADSFIVLADLAAYFDEFEELLGGPENRWYEALLERGADMVERSWPDDRRGTLPWVVGDNRPALSLLADYVDLLDEGDDRYEDLTVLYLRLNPSDNHGCRTDRMNLLLEAGRDAEALELGQRYPDDMFAETRYGVGLALYRLGREAEAVDAMNGAVEHLPQVLRYLLRNKIEQPSADERGLHIGGEFQAWLYRDDMRATWLAVPGMKDWLKQFVERGQAALRRDRARRRR